VADILYQPPDRGSVHVFAFRGAARAEAAHVVPDQLDDAGLCEALQIGRYRAVRLAGIALQVVDRELLAVADRCPCRLPSVVVGTAPQVCWLACHAYTLRAWVVPV